VQQLEIHHVTSLDLAETSALTTWSSPGDPPRLLAVGDEDFAVVSAEIDEGGALGRVGRDDLRPALRHTAIDLRSGSGFEGVACDGEGTIVLLQEEQARVLVFAPDLSRLLHTLELAVPVDDPVLNPAWRRAANSRGEGLLLLRGGHVLIAKERDVPCLIEFGAAGDLPIGVSPGTVLAPDETWQFPDDAKTESVPLAVWQLGDRTAALLPTINDLALGTDGHVYALSAHAQVIARMERHLTPGERAGASAAWQIADDLPGGRDARPEGLTFLPSGRPVVGIDGRQGENNLVVLEPLDGR
jgi:hypothetical protein